MPSPVVMLRANIEYHEKAGPEHKKHTVYVIAVEKGGKTWTVKRRYSEFDTLCSLLREADYTLPQLPPKAFLTRFSPSVLEERMEKLEAFLQACVSQAGDSVNASKFVENGLDPCEIQLPEPQNAIDVRDLRRLRGRDDVDWRNRSGRRGRRRSCALSSHQSALKSPWRTGLRGSPRAAAAALLAM